MNSLEKKLSKLSSFKINKIDSSNFISSLRNRQRIESLRKKRFQSGIRGLAFVTLISLITSLQLDDTNYQDFDNEIFNINDILVEVDEIDFGLFLIEETVDIGISELIYYNSFLIEDVEG
ncbi:hypothetical protein N9E35_02730 [Candidatus Marinimicrobia bacterium]|nr:hypothetical protein [Candidatus Neomarinimicrobiota bacterium]